MQRATEGEENRRADEPDHSHGVSVNAAEAKAATLVEALPYIRRFAGKIVVVKYGGNALAGASEDDALALFAEDIGRWWCTEAGRRSPS